MADLVRDAPLGQLTRWATGNRCLQYPEERPDFKLPQPWQQLRESPHALVGSSSSASSLGLNTPNGGGAAGEEKERKEQAPDGHPSSVFAGDGGEAQEGMERVKSVPVVPQQTKDGAILVDWYYSDDAENPHNWTNGKRALISVIVCLYTFVVYTTSAIYTSSSEGIMAEFGVSQLEATLGLSLYVLGYGIGPLIFSPLSEIPRIGRNPVYIVTMFLFVILSIPTAFAPNFAGLMVLRFLQGFFGSPCLASGGASLGDMYSLMAVPFAMVAWVSAAYCGRTFAPCSSSLVPGGRPAAPALPPIP